MMVSNFGAGGLCLNCGAPLADRYCGRCGQKQASRLSWHHVIHDAVEHVLHLESPLFRTVVDLSVRPGELGRRYVEGRRAPYVDPAKYVLLVGTMLLVAWHLVDPGVVASVSPTARGPAEIGRTILSLYGYYLFAMLLPVAWTQSMFYRRTRGLRVVECYAFDLYVFGHALWINVLTAPLGVAPGSPTSLGIYLAQLAYVTWAVRAFYRIGIARAAGMGTILFVAYMLSAAAVGFATFGVLAVWHR
jgi:hypothetical protein